MNIQHYLRNEDMECKCHFASKYIYPKESDNDDVAYRDIYAGNTVAMYLAQFLIYIPPHWQHDPTLRNKQGKTVAMIMAYNNCGGFISIVDADKFFWYHNPLLQTNIGQTVAMILAQQGKIPPTIWQHDPTYNTELFGKGFTVAMALAMSNTDIPSQWQYDARRKAGQLGNTIAMIMASRGNVPPPTWQHDPTIRNDLGQTVAMIYADRGNNIPEEWKHDPLLYDFDGKTVAMIYVTNHVCPVSYWLHDKDVKNAKGETLEKYFKYYNVRLPYEWLTFIIQYVVKENVDHNICMICLEDECVQQCQTLCGHTICPTCCCKYEKHKCPYCKMKGFRVREKIMKDDKVLSQRIVPELRSDVVYPEEDGYQMSDSDTGADIDMDDEESSYWEED